MMAMRVQNFLACVRYTNSIVAVKKLTKNEYGCCIIVSSMVASHV